MRKFSSIIMTVVLTAGLILPAQGAVKSLALKVDGLACPFCAYGLEKKLKKVEGVESLKIDIDAGEVTMDMKPEVRLATTSEKRPGLVDAVKKAVIEGGFTPREFRATVEGNVLAEDGGWRLRVPETGEILTLVEIGSVKKIEALEDKQALVTGVLEGEAPPVTMVVEKIVEATDAAFERYRLKISGMVCSGCTDAIQMALEQVEGVRVAEVDLERGVAFVTTDSTLVDPERLVTAVNGLSMEGMAEGTFQASTIR